MLFFSFLLLLRKAALLFLVALRTVLRGPRQLGCFTLHLQRLLRSCADPGGGLLSELTLRALGIGGGFLLRCGNRRTEAQSAVIFEQIFPNLVVFGSAPKVILHTERRCLSMRSNTPTQNGGSKNTVSFVESMSITNPS